MSGEAIERLEQGIEEFLSAHVDTAISAGRVINPLLDLWSMATEVDASVAAPIERLLTGLVSRDLTTASELSESMEEVRLAYQTLEPTTV